MRIKSKDIAAALGISPATVSLVLNEKPGVNPVTRRKVQEYLEQLEKRNNSRIRAESPEGRGTVLMLNYIKHGIIMKRLENISQPLHLDNFEYMVNKAGYRFDYQEFYEKSNDLEKFLQKCVESDVKGIFIMAAEMNQSDIYPFQQLKIPIVVGDNLFYEQGMDSFLIDNKEGIRRGVDYLVDKGHSHIVYLAENLNIFNFEERREAFVQEMAERQCGDSSNRIVHLGNTVDEVYESMNHYLAGGLRKTTAFVLESNVISLGVSKALLERNIKVPKEVSLVGFDALPELSIPGLNLTLIKGTHTKRFTAALKHLIRHILNEGEEDEMVRVYYRTRLIEGDSVFDKTKYIYK
ncbi:LacI family DNA-binding transcriptional regulator [Clostridium sp. Marseille-P2415]|uniref:LacI family DNA-binding transcriptional regulator n=1 Tax=Clostridium sp. Marseille-P2415 TaxID=1805471 RepID=UPI00135669F0|nr:LacI family DNA-binding transcriptional regulator [Clostridium sp. Marseille-P2415]